MGENPSGRTAAPPQISLVVVSSLWPVNTQDLRLSALPSMPLPAPFFLGFQAKRSQRPAHASATSSALLRASQPSTHTPRPSPRRRIVYAPGFGRACTNVVAAATERKGKQPRRELSNCPGSYPWFACSIFCISKVIPVLVKWVPALVRSGGGVAFTPFLVQLRVEVQNIHARGKASCCTPLLSFLY